MPPVSFDPSKVFDVTKHIRLELRSNYLIGGVLQRT